MSHLAAEQLEALATSGGSDAHVEGCSQCKLAVRQAKGRRALLKGMKDFTLTDAAFRRVEAKLASELQAATTPWGLVLGQLRNNWALFAVAVALIAFVAVPRLMGSSSTGTVAPPAPQVAVKSPVAAPKPRAVELLAVLVEGPVSRNGAALAAGDVVKAGDAVDARKGRVVFVEAAHEGRLELMGAAKFGGAATASLEEGVLAVDSAAEVLVEAGAWVSGTDAAFVVTRAAAEVVVDALRGQVYVASDSELRHAVKLTAPAQLKVPLPMGASFASPSSEVAPYPFSDAPARPTGKLDLSDLGTGSFDVDGQRMGGTPASMLLSAGRHKLRTQTAGQPARESWVDLVAGGTTRSKAPAQPVASAHEVEDVAVSDEAIAEVQRAIKEQKPKLRACYEKWLKATPSATGQVELTLVVSKTGKVSAARVEDKTIPQESIDCLVRTGKTLRLPPLGSEQEIAVPLVLTPGAR